MENPATWGIVEKTINKALQEHMAAVNSGMIGGSPEAAITKALREAGLLKEEEKKTTQKG